MMPLATAVDVSILRYFGRLKSPEAQQRNVRKALHVLAGGQARFMTRSWNTTSMT
jgi:hypothetical protein